MVNDAVNQVDKTIQKAPGFAVNRPWLTLPRFPQAHFRKRFAFAVRSSAPTTAVNRVCETLGETL